MTIDSWADLRATKDVALAGLTGDPVVDSYEAGAIGISWADLTGERTAPEYSGASLTVQMPGVTFADAHMVSVVQDKMQRAAALIAKSMIPTEAEKTGVYPADRQRALLLPQSAIGDTVVFRFQAGHPETGDLFDGVHVASAAERAAVDLVQRLPAGPEDDAALKAVLGTRPTVRKAMSEIVSAAKLTQGVIIRFSADDGEVTSAQLDFRQANQLGTDLAEAERMSEMLPPVEGVLDGVRSKRRVFYLIKDDGSEVSGALDEDLASRIKELRTHEDQRVSATIRQSWTQNAAGVRSRFGYELIEVRAVEPAPELPFDV